MLLPPESMPWGRWVGDELAQNEEVVAQARNERSNAQGLFNTRADSITDQIYSVDGLANITMYDIPEFTRSFPGYTTNFYTQYVHSPDIVVAANRSPSNGFIFVQIHAQWVSGADPEKLLQAYPLITMVGSETLTTQSTQPGGPIDTNVFHGSVWSLYYNPLPRGTGAAFTTRFSLGSNYFGTTANPLTVKFTGCKIGIVEIGTLQP